MDVVAATAGTAPAADLPAAPALALPTPYLALDIAAAVRRYRRLGATLPGTALHYAVKANPHPDLLAALRGAGACFDVASPTEVRACLAAGAAAADLVYSNPVKRRADVAEAAALGVRLFAVDSAEETRKVAAAAPGAAVLTRLLTSGSGSDWPLSRKYGCTTSQAVAMLHEEHATAWTRRGSASTWDRSNATPGAWDAPIEAAARVFTALRGAGHRPWLLDLGGGFPAALEGGAPPLPAYGAAIERSLRRHFGADRPRTIAEPGRAVVADAGRVVSTVIAVLRRGEARWVYLDAGVFTGLVETLDEAIRYRLVTSADGGPTGPCVLAGPTCDSADVLYERAPVRLPLCLAEGDTVELRAAGAYTTCYSTVGFNGFAPMSTALVAS